ncbi:MAG: hypothetical protein WA324_24895 [Bryobacteraceae bacterium]
MSMRLMRVWSSALSLSALCAAAAVIVWAGPAWLTKDFKDWTQKDASAVLTESAWARVMPMPSSERPSQVIVDNGALAPGSQSSSAIGPNMTNTSMTGANQGSEGGNPSRTPAMTPAAMAQSTGAPATQPTVTVIWASALPVRLAELKLRTQGNPLTNAQIQAAMKPRERYVIVVVGLPPPDDLSQVNALAATSSLGTRGKTIPCSESDFRTIANHNLYIFRFPKTSIFNLDDRDVEFRMTMGHMQIKRKFELRDMIYQGNLAL